MIIMIVITIEVIIILVNYCSSNTDHHKILTNDTVRSAVNISNNSILVRVLF